MLQFEFSNQFDTIGVAVVHLVDDVCTSNDTKRFEEPSPLEIVECCRQTKDLIRVIKCTVNDDFVENRTSLNASIVLAMGNHGDDSGILIWIADVLVVCDGMREGNNLGVNIGSGAIPGRVVVVRVVEIESSKAKVSRFILSTSVLVDLLGDPVSKILANLFQTEPFSPIVGPAKDATERK